MYLQDHLTKNQRHVLDVLLREKSALSAYAILDRLRAHGLRAPLQIYRALEKLVKLGLVHRLESVNAFIACAHPGCKRHGLAAFTICQTCGAITEFDIKDITGHITNHMEALHFQPAATTLEIRGTCATCQ